MLNGKVVLGHPLASGNRLKLRRDGVCLPCLVVHFKLSDTIVRLYRRVSLVTNPSRCSSIELRYPTIHGIQ